MIYIEITYKSGWQYWRTMPYRPSLFYRIVKYLDNAIHVESYSVRLS